MTYNTLTDIQKAELKRRFDYYKAHSEESIPLEQVKAVLNRRATKR